MLVVQHKIIFLISYDIDFFTLLFVIITKDTYFNAEL